MGVGGSSPLISTIQKNCAYALVLLMQNAWRGRLFFLFFAPNVNAKAFSATFYFYNLIIFFTLCLPMASAKRCFARVVPPLTSITPPLAPFKRWGSVALPLNYHLREPKFESTHLYQK